MFVLQFHYLTGRAVATAYNDREVAEWPPHPARVFSALVAVWAGSDPPDGAERAALEWLENQGPPMMSAPSASPRDVLPHFVPVNDTTVLGDLTRYYAAVEAAEAAVAAREKGADAALKKATAALNRAMVKAVAVAEKPSGQDRKSAERLFPDHRPKQARTFPSVTIDSTNSVPADTLPVQFGWPDADPGEHEAALHRLASRLARLGHSSSLVRCVVSREPFTPNWVPDTDGTDNSKPLRVVSAGQLDRLEADFAIHRGVESRVMPCSFQLYSCTDRQSETPVHRSGVFGADDNDWIVFWHHTKPHVSTTRTVDVATAVRGALLHYAGPSAPEILTGHGPDGMPSTRPHIAIVPLPWVASQYSSGEILGVALILPRACPAADRLAVQRAIGNWLNVSRHSEEKKGPGVELQLPGGVTLPMELVWERAPRTTLQPRTWIEPSTHWLSATPIALDRNPGDLRSSNADRQALAYANAEEIIAQAAVNIGMPVPAEVTVLPSVPMPGTFKAQRYPSFPQDPNRPRRVKVHAAITFNELIEGPLLLGAGRYLGLGLMRPVIVQEDR